MPKAHRNLGARSATLLIRPCALATGRWDVATASICGFALVVVLVIEMLTPNDVVASLALLPLIAAMWTLSTRMASAVSLTAAVVFGVILAGEAGSRPTVLLVGAVGLVFAVAVRSYAIALAKVLRISQRDGLTGARRREWPGLAFAVPEGIDALTRRELEVATFASRGYTAVEIGNQLHISERTVESHLANTYAKLAIHSRSALRTLSGRFTN